MSVRHAGRPVKNGGSGGASSWLLALLEAGEKRDGAVFPGLRQPGTAGPSSSLPADQTSTFFFKGLLTAEAVSGLLEPF